MASKTTTLEFLRSAVSERQRSILDDVWSHIKATHLGIPERPLMDKFGKEALLKETAKLGGTVVYSNHEENKNRYNLGLVGIFLTSEGVHLEKVVQQYLVVLRDAYARNKEIERFSSKDLASWAPDISTSDLTALRHILYRGHGSFASSIGGWNAEEWFISVDNDVVELRDVSDWSRYIELRILKWYDARQPSGEIERMNYHASKSKPDPIWNAIRQTDFLSGSIVPPSKARKVPSQPASTLRGRKLDLSFMKDDLALKVILESDWKEACQHFRARAWKSCVLLCGGVVEGLLLWQLENVQKGMPTEGGLDKIDIRYDGEMLSGVIRKSKEQGLIGEDEQYLMEWARVFRNVIHPGNQRREGRTPLKSHADLALKLVQVVGEGIRSKKARRTPLLRKKRKGSL